MAAVDVLQAADLIHQLVGERDAEEHVELGQVDGASGNEGWQGGHCHRYGPPALPVTRPTEAEPQRHHA